MYRKLVFTLTLISLLQEKSWSQQFDTLAFSKKIDTLLFPKILDDINLNNFSFEVKAYSRNRLAKTYNLSNKNNTAIYTGKSIDTLHFLLLIPRLKNDFDSFSIKGIGSFFYNQNGSSKGMEEFFFNIDFETPPLKIKLTSIPSGLIAYCFTTMQWEMFSKRIKENDQILNIEDYRFDRGYTPVEKKVAAYVYVVCVKYNGNFYPRIAKPTYDNPNCEITIDIFKEQQLNANK